LRSKGKSQILYIKKTKGQRQSGLERGEGMETGAERPPYKGGKEEMASGKKGRRDHDDERGASCKHRFKKQLCLKEKKGSKSKKKVTRRAC